MGSSVVFRRLALAGALVALGLVVGCASNRDQTQASETAQLQAQAKLAADATTVLQQQMLQPSQARIPRALIEKARCIAVFPTVTEAGLIFGGSRGTGLISCRQRTGNYMDAPPAVYTVSSASIGLQAGAAQSSVILLFTTLQSTRAVLDSLVKLGSQVAVSAGPRGYDQPISDSAPIVAYGISKKGLFAGLNLSGSKVAFNKPRNSVIYNVTDPQPREILLQTPRIPQSMANYVEAVEQFTNSAG